MTTTEQNKPIARFAIPALTELPADIREKILTVQEKSGFVPNVFLVLSRRPDEFRAFFAYHDALMVKDTGSLTKADREMIVTTTSAKNNCLYCVVAHGAILRIYAKNPLVADQVAVNHHKADISPRQKAMLDFAVKVCLDSQAVGDEDYTALKEHGFDDEDIWDITAITGFFGMSNRLANVLSMRPNDEFFMLGRLPKK
ncbi:MAG: peroxidase-related enzyme [Alcaligenaceae bacterium]|nr:peroxidase-related enzyme [Alcaligenaceae bacterium]